jgi:hypothetical protein
MRRVVLACLLALGAGGAWAQAVAPTPAAEQPTPEAGKPTPSAPSAAPATPAADDPACPHASEVKQEHLLGLWRAEFEGQAQGATLLLEKHPSFALSLRGAINRNGERGQLAGDIEDGEITLEESANGSNISAVWLGDVVEGSCGREIRGAWKAEGDPRQFQFVLRKQ